ncbi:MAG: response regulator [Dehalococcoidia bacterium]
MVIASAARGSGSKSSLEGRPVARVLLTEDEERMAALVADALRDDGREVEVTHDSASALQKAREGGFEVLVLDVMLPDIDGFTVCRELRRSGVRTAVLMLTARDAVEDRVQGLDVGADDYLVKPFAVAELRARVRALVRRPAGLRGLGTRRRPGARSVSAGERDGHRLDLTAREFGFLAFLLRHEGETLTRAEILDGVWGEVPSPTRTSWTCASTTCAEDRAARRSIDPHRARRGIRAPRARPLVIRAARQRMGGRPDARDSRGAAPHGLHRGCAGGGAAATGSVVYGLLTKQLDEGSTNS